MKNFLPLIIFALTYSLASGQKAHSSFTPADTLKIQQLNEQALKARQSDPSKALKQINEAIALAEKTGYKPALAMSYNHAGLIYSGIANHPKALENHFKALKVREEMDDKKGISASYNNIGTIYYHQANYELALEYMTSSLRIKEELNDKKGASYSYNNIGNIYYQLHKYPSSLEFHLKSLKIKEELSDKKGMAASLSNIGNVYVKLGQMDLALEYQQKALKLREGTDDKKGLTESYINIGDIYIKTKKAEEGIAFHRQALKLALETGARDLQKFAYEGLSAASREIKNYEDALKYYELAIAIKDTLFNSENSKAIAEMQARYETEKKEKEIELLTKDKALQFSLLKQEQLYAAKKENEIILLNKSRELQQLTLDKRNAELKKQLAEKEAAEKKADLLSKEKQIKEGELERQTFISWAAASGAALVLILAAVSIRGYSQKKKANQLLALQKGEIEERNRAIEAAYSMIEEKNKDITDSIRYAERIQQAILPPDSLWKSVLPESFVFYKPKDILCGDFYWLEKRDDDVFIAAVDCTGHGVPGALMSIVGYNLLNKAVLEQGILAPSDILNQLNKWVTVTLRQTMHESSVRDGMDISFCKINMRTRELQFAGAYNPLYIVREETLIEIKADKFPVGIFLNEEMRAFTNHTVQLEEGDVIYMFSDGFPDQFGGEKGKKFKMSRFRDLLVSISRKEPALQKNIIDASFEQWKGRFEQTDDVLVVGVKIV
jgi:serine phosphatase RsbU (regulator of sigma subunit)/tetratricopeptide (TPR) repeat protein